MREFTLEGKYQFINLASRSKLSVSFSVRNINFDKSVIDILERLSNNPIICNIADCPSGVAFIASKIELNCVSLTSLVNV